MIDGMKDNGNPAPEFTTDDGQVLFMVTLLCHPELQGIPKEEAETDKTVSLTLRELLEKVSDVDDLNNLVNSIQSDNWKEMVSKSVSKSKAFFGLKIWPLIQFISIPRSRYEIFKHIRVTNQSKNKSRLIDPLIEIGWLEMTIPDKPNSRLQQYKLTEKGKKLLKQ